MNDPATIERNVSARYQVLLIIWAAQLLALVAFFLLALFLFEDKGESHSLLFQMLTGLTCALVAASFTVKKKFFAQAVEKQSAAMVQQGQIVAMALCEAAGLYGLMERAIAGTTFFYLSFIVAGVGMLLHFPKRERLMAASFKNRI